MRSGTRLCALLFCGLALAGCSNSSSGGPTVVSVPLQEAFDFGLVRADIATIARVTLRKAFAGAANVTLVSSTGPFAPAPGELPKGVATGVRFDLDVSYTPPPGSAGVFQAGTVRVRLTEVNNRFVDDVILSLTAEGEVAAITLQTVALDFGNTAVGQTVTQNVRVRNPNVATPVSITNATTNGDNDLTLRIPSSGFPITIGPQASADLVIDYAPTAAASHGANLIITNSVAGPLNAAIAGTGVPGEVEVLNANFPIVGGGFTDFIEFDLTPEAVSVLIEIFPDAATTSAFNLVELEGPNNKIYENNFSGPYIWFMNFPSGLGGDDGMILQMPNSDAPDVQLVPGGGTYRLRLQEFGTNTGYNVRVIMEQRNNAVPTAGVLHLNLFFSPGTGITAAGAPTDPFVQDALTVMDILLSQIGLPLGSVSYFDVANPAYDDITIVGSEVFLLVAESSAAPEDRLNLFFVNTIDGPGSGTLGISIGLPGTNRNGTFYSGVINAIDGTTGPLIGSTLAHEGAHFLGLFHTTQHDSFGNPISPDLIEDTPSCPLFMTTPLCPVEGNHNLEWPFEISGLNPEDYLLTSGQGRVILGHPLIDLN